MKQTKTWSRCILAAALLAAALLLLWRGAASPPPAAVDLSLSAEPPTVGTMGAVSLAAAVGPDAPDCTYRWRAPAGALLTEASAGQWRAPAQAGTYTLAVTASCGEAAPVTAEVDVAVIAYRPPASAPGPLADREPTTDSTDIYAIDAIAFEKPWICANDDVRVFVDARDPAGQSEWVEPRVTLAGGSATGFDAIVRPSRHYFSRRGSHYGEQTVHVSLFDMRTTQAVASKEVTYEVRDCDAPGAGVAVECKDRGSDVVACRAYLVGAAAEGAAPVHYTWSVDDLPGQDTRGPDALLRLPDKVEDSAFNSWDITVTAHAADAPARSGRTTHTAPNEHWESYVRFGVLELKVWHESYPQRRGDNLVTRVRVTNPFSEPVMIDALKENHFRCGDNVAVDGGAPSPLDVLGTNALEPGETVELEWTMPDDPARCEARQDLVGRGVHSDLAVAAAWVMPTDPARSRTLTGAEQARAVRALEILSERAGEPVTRVTTRQLAELDRRGLLPSADVSATP